MKKLSNLLLQKIRELIRREKKKEKKFKIRKIMIFEGI